MSEKICYVLGLGESIVEYLESGQQGYTIGVNDIYRYVSTNVVVCIDNPTSFNTERQRIINNSTPEHFYTHIPLWNHMPGYKRIKLLSGYPKAESLLTSDVYYSHNNSPFVACQVAAKLGYNQIVVYGVDLNTHHQLSRPDAVNEILLRYEKMSAEMRKLGISLFVGSENSQLKNVLPLWKEKN